MTNWLERAEQERRRLVAEAETKQLNEQRRRKEAEDEIRQKLELYYELGIPEKLEEIKRDIFRGLGVIKPIEGFITHEFGTTGHILRGSIYKPGNEIYETIYEGRWGKYTERINTSTSGPYGKDRDDSYVEKQRRGWHKVEVGRIYKGREEVRKDYDLSCSLEYNARLQNYHLSVAGEKKRVSGDFSQLRPSLLVFIDQSLLSFAMNPDFGNNAKRTRIEK